MDEATHCGVVASKASRVPQSSHTPLHSISSHLIQFDLILSCLILFHQSSYLVMGSNKMSVATFIEELESERTTFDDEIHPLPKYQYKAFELCCDLLREDGTSMAQRSDQHRSSRLRVRTLFTDVFVGLGAEVFLLCTLATSITKLSTISHRDLFSQLRAWWKSASHPCGLTETANDL